MSDYRVPSMVEINALPWNRFKVASTFSCGGGSCLGYRMAGYKVVYANEFIEEAINTYKANNKDTILDSRDIRTVTADDILDKIGLKVGELDIFDGSPPCSAFSTAGKREKGWGQKKSYSDNATQVVDDLFYEYARLVRGIQPKVFIAENVSGLVKGTAKGYFLNILKELRSCGYKVEAKLLDSKWLGVPQSRERLIFVGVREDLDKNPIFPKPIDRIYTLGDVLASTKSNPEKDSWMTRYSTGKEWDKLAIGGRSEKYFQLVRCSPKYPCPTITASGGDASKASISHPFECRKFSISEIRKICSFPDDFILTGSYAQQYERMGRAVPPVMMSHIARAIQYGVLERTK